jgi:hypothetical protein
MDYKTIPVLMHNQAGAVDAKLDPEDYEKVIDFAKVWRLTTNGYARTTKNIDGQFKMFYMHSLIAGDRARHINGDRVDNRRKNLVTISKKRVNDDLPPNDYKISRPTVISEECMEFHHEESTLPFHTGYAIIHYKKGKHYSGSVTYGIPEGYGVLYEEECQRQSMGMWRDGRMEEGMVLHYRPLPSCLCQAEILCPLRVVDRVEVVKGGYRVI